MTVLFVCKKNGGRIMWIYFILVNSVGLIAMAIDKAHAKKQARRIPEKKFMGAWVYWWEFRAIYWHVPLPS